MACPECDSPVVVFAVPESYRDGVPDSAAAASLCTACLTLSPAADAVPEDEPAFDRISEVFPTGAGAVETALVIGLLDSLALNRETIESLVREAEAAGTDPLLVLERLQSEPELSPAVDLDRRTHQLRQFL